MQKPNLSSYSSLLLLAAIWGSAFFNYKIILRSFDALTLSGARLVFASIFFLFIAIFFIPSFKGRNFFSKDWYIFLIIGLVNYALPFSLIAFGIDNMSSGLAALLQSAAPFYAILFSHIFTHDDKFNKFKFIGTCFGFTGVLILIYDQIHLTKTTDIISVLLVMGASVFYMIGGLIIGKIKKYNNETVTCFSLIWGAIILLPLTIYFYDNSSPKVFHIESLYSLIYLGVVSTAIAFYLRSKIILRNGIVFMSQVTFLIPVFGVFFSYFFLQEKLYLSMFLSLGLLMIGLIILQKGYKKNVT